MDLTERKAAEDRLHLLAREVDQRANNLLAAVQSIVNLTRAKDVPSFRERIRGRLSALANAHRLLSESRWTGAGLARIVAEELEPFRDGHVLIDGPDARLAPPSPRPSPSRFMSSPPTRPSMAPCPRPTGVRR